MQRPSGRSEAPGAIRWPARLALHHQRGPNGAPEQKYLWSPAEAPERVQPLLHVRGPADCLPTLHPLRLPCCETRETRWNLSGADCLLTLLHCGVCPRQHWLGLQVQCCRSLNHRTGEPDSDRTFLSTPELWCIVSHRRHFASTAGQCPRIRDCGALNVKRGLRSRCCFPQTEHSAVWDIPPRARGTTPGPLSRSTTCALPPGRILPA